MPNWIHSFTKPFHYLRLVGKILLREDLVDHGDKGRTVHFARVNRPAKQNRKLHRFEERGPNGNIGRARAVATFLVENPRQFYAIRRLNCVATLDVTDFHDPTIATTNECQRGTRKRPLGNAPKTLSIESPSSGR
jgi:hypothetical protein